MIKEFNVNFTEKEISSVYQKIKDYPWKTMPDLDGWEHGTNKKYLNALVSNVSTTLYLLKKKKFTLPLLTLVHILCTFGLLFILPQFLFEISQGKIIKFDINLSYILIYLALFPSIGSYYCWAGAVSIIGANRAGIFLSLIPLFSTILAMIFFNEKFLFFHFIGSVLIILGLFLSNKKITNA